MPRFGLKSGLTGAIRDLWRRPPGQLAGLDVLRSIAVLLVVFAHARGEWLRQGGEPNNFTQFFLVRDGYIGVDLFFVLSGYLIGKQLWVELRETRTIQIGKFIIRRGLRIWPLFFFFLVFDLAVLGRGDFPYGSWWSDAVFLTNYINRGVVMGSWSLCTEEQFYILAPLLIVAGARLTASPANYRRFLWLLLFLQPLTRMIIWVSVGGTLAPRNPEIFRDYIYGPIHTHADGLILGMLIANYQVTDPRFRSRWLPGSVWGLGLAVAVCLVFRLIHREILGFTGISLVFGAAVCMAIMKPSIAANWFVRSRIFYLCSRLSYGMYLNHEYLQMDAVGFVRKTFAPTDQFPAVYAAVSAVTLALVSGAFAVLTFCLIEYPFLQLRSRLLGSHKKQHMTGTGSKSSLVGSTNEHAGTALAEPKVVNAP